MEMESQLTKIQEQKYIYAVEHYIMTEKIQKMQREKSDFKLKFEKLWACLSHMESARNVVRSGRSSQRQDLAGMSSRHDDGNDDDDGCFANEDNVPERVIDNDDDDDDDDDDDKAEDEEDRRRPREGMDRHGSARRLSAIDAQDMLMKSDSELDGIVRDQKASLRQLTEDNKALSSQLKNVKKERDHFFCKLQILSKAIRQMKGSRNVPLGNRKSTSFRSSMT
eukprot:CAMPEP_0172483166 /NCGR_PEP_ID=MMETSP1066-20121228/10038_1 /TAXON_ID=671091 /ORGANISM="Coscinodiscus wailesii, Strain CCMP2513" /LENGTH=222 /DNA_ID=CAMNT_0013246877 /DNA_START=203 /DNA_END=871 /DNA_ORIENTATION=+